MSNEKHNKEELGAGVVENQQRLEDIRAMMDIGHKSIRIEKHTFFYWGIAGGLLTLLIAFLYRESMLMNTTIYTLMCAAILGVVGYLDYRKTRDIRRSQDKSVSFIQVRMTRIWWLLIATAVLFVVGIDIYGGIAVHSVWFILIGVAIIIHASFSTQPLARYDVAFIAVGIVSPALLPYSGLMWLAVSIFSVGVPLLGFMLYQKSGFWQAGKPYAVFMWLVIAILPSCAVYAVGKSGDTLRIPSTVVSLADYQNLAAPQAGFQIIKLPAGTKIPLMLSAKGGVIEDSGVIQLPLVLSDAVELVLENGKLNGTYRVGTGAWSTLKSWQLLSIRDLRINMTPEQGFTVNAQLRVLDKK